MRYLFFTWPEYFPKDYRIIEIDVENGRSRVFIDYRSNFVIPKSTCHAWTEMNREFGVSKDCIKKEISREEAFAYLL